MVPEAFIAATSLRTHFDMYIYIYIYEDIFLSMLYFNNCDMSAVGFVRANQEFETSGLKRTFISMVMSQSNVMIPHDARVRDFFFFFK